MGPNGQAPVLGARRWPTRATSCSRHYEHTYVAPGSGSRGGCRPTTPSTATSRPSPHAAVAAVDFATVGDIFSARAQPRAQEAVRHPLGDAGGRRPGPPAAGALARLARRARPSSSGTPTSAASRSRCIGMESRPLPRRGCCPPTARAWTPGTLFPQSSRKLRPGDQRGQRQPAAGGPGQPVRLRRVAGVDAATCSWSTAPRSAGRSSTSTGPIVFWSSPATTAARSSCSPRRSTTTWRSPRSRARTRR